MAEPWGKFATALIVFLPWAIGRQCDFQWRLNESINLLIDLFT